MKDYKVRVNYDGVKKETLLSNLDLNNLLLIHEQLNPPAPTIIQIPKHW